MIQTFYQIGDRQQIELKGNVCTLKTNFRLIATEVITDEEIKELHKNLGLG